MVGRDRARSRRVPEGAVVVTTIRAATAADAGALANLRWEFVGQVWVHLIQKVPNPAAERERHMYLSNLYVRPEARGGVGTRLLEAALEWAVSQHVDRVVLWPTDRSRPLYLRHGFTADVDLLELELETRG
ncbi:MAG: hypothetical protein DMG04_00145 [Acidobacteria bacterium]|nr:MAG: hypothetical protein DMG04_00145 [Acidobacteriota bacterium]